MKSNIYIIPVLFLLLFAAAGLTACTESPTSYTFITEEEVRRIMTEVEIATQNKDIESVIRHMAPSIRINVTVESRLGIQKHRFTRKKYKTETEKSWSMTSDYKYERENEIILISEDGQSAIVESNISESILVQGRRLKTNILEKAKIEVIDGQFLITKLDAYIKM